MQITGNQLRQQITRAKKKKEVYEKVMQKSLYKFESDEDVPDPKELIDKIDALEFRIVKMQTALSIYNTVVTVEIEGEEFPLVYAIKVVGAIDRCAALWAGIAGEAGAGIGGAFFAGRSSRVRDKDAEVAKKQINDAEAMKHLENWSEKASKTRTIIAQANTTLMDLDRLGLLPEHLL